MSASRRKITRYSLRVMEYGTENQLPINIFRECITAIMALPRTNRKIDDSRTNRIHLLSRLRMQSDVGVGYFISAKHHHRPPLIHSETLNTRDNPKEITEGEEEKTHFALGFRNDEAYLLLETKHGGISMNKFVYYLSRHLRTTRDDRATIICDIIVAGDFIAKLRTLSRVSAAEIFTDSSLLTDTFMRDVPVTASVRDEVELIIKAKKRASLPARMFSTFYRQFMKEERKISRMKILGRSQADDFVLLDTDRLAESEYIDVELDDNGQVISSSIMPKLRQMVQNML